MKAKWGALVVDGRGKIGGHVMTKNRQGAAMRTKVTPANRQSGDQTTARNSFAAYSTGWRALTQAQRDSWNSAAGDVNRTNIFGDGYHPTGKNLYALTNINLILAGGSAVTAPPLATLPVNLTALALASNTTAAQSITFTVTPVEAGNTVIVEATRPMSPGVTSPGKAYRKFTTVAAAGTSPLNSYAAYVTKFGTPILGKKIFFRVYKISTVSGLRTLPLVISGITA